MLGTILFDASVADRTTVVSLRPAMRWCRAQVALCCAAFFSFSVGVPVGLEREVSVGAATSVGIVDEVRSVDAVFCAATSCMLGICHILIVCWRVVWLRRHTQR